MFWILMYLTAAAAVASCLSLLADRWGSDAGCGPGRVGAVCVAAGALWPVLALGAAELAVVMAFAGRTRSPGAPGLTLVN